MSEIVAGIIGAAFGAYLAWFVTGAGVVKECDLLGGFTYGQKVYSCEVRK